MWKVVSEEVSSVDSQRVELENALDYIREGDVLVVKKLDRLARSVADTVKIIERLEAKKAGLKILNMKIDTTTPEEDYSLICLLQLLSLNVK